MILKSLILGVAFNIAIFAIKSGIGISYCLCSQKQSGRSKGPLSRGKKACALFVFALCYFLVVMLAETLLLRVDLTTHFPQVMELLQSGMMLHTVLAIVMAVWGIVILKKTGHGKSETTQGSKSLGWLLLAMPCPMCSTVIILSMAVLHTFLPEHSASIVFFFYGLFMLISFTAMLVAHLLQRHTALAPEEMLGGSMLLIATYFFLSATVMPQFAEMDTIYRIASYSGEKQGADITGYLRYMLPLGILFILTFIYRFRILRSFK